MKIRDKPHITLRHHYILGRWIAEFGEGVNRYHILGGDMAALKANWHRFRLHKDFLIAQDSKLSRK